MNTQACDRVKVIMMTMVVDTKNVMDVFMEGTEAYLTKPIEKAKLLGEFKRLGFIE